MTVDAAIAAATPVPERARRASFVERLARRAADAPFAACVGIDPSPEALALLETHSTAGPTRALRVTRAGAIERFAGLVIESARDHAAAVKLQVAWYEAAGAPGMRALERSVEFARTAGLLVILDAKRGDVPHTAAAYADAWLGDAASSGMGVDALTVHPALGADALEAMASIAATRHCALYALLHTSNPGAADLQALELADGRTWWHAVADVLARVDAATGPGVVGAVVGATRPATVAQARTMLPGAPLLLPGIGAQGGDVAELASATATGAPTSLVVAARSLLPAEPTSTLGFRDAVFRAAGELGERCRALGVQ